PAHAAARSVRPVREIHNLALVEVDGHTELSLHLKLPGDLTLEEAHEVAEEVERAICAAAPEIASGQTPLGPLTEATPAHEEDVDTAPVERTVRDATGSSPRELRFLR